MGIRRRGIINVTKHEGGVKGDEERCDTEEDTASGGETGIETNALELVLAMFRLLGDHNIELLVRTVGRWCRGASFRILRN